MNAFINDLNRHLDARLLEISRQETGTISKARASSKCVKQTLIQLRDFVLHYSFRDELEEIDFFKTIKPNILSKYIYHRKIYQIESMRPVGGREIHQTYLRNELENLSLFHSQHLEFYQYYRTGEAYKDSIYFLRSNENLSIYDDDIACSMDCQFSTGYDYLVAKIVAFDQLSAWLYNRIDALDTPIQPAIVDNPDTLLWACSQTDLVELIYAFDSLKVIIGSTYEIKHLVTFFEKSFNIKLTDVYHTYTEIKNRSKRTKFIDSLKTALLQRFENDDA